MTVHCPPLTDPKPQTVTTAGFVTVVDGVVALQRVTQLKFSGVCTARLTCARSRRVQPVRTHRRPPAALLPDAHHRHGGVLARGAGRHARVLGGIARHAACVCPHPPSPPTQVATLLQVPVITSVNLGENKLTESGYRQGTLPTSCTLHTAHPTTHGAQHTAHNTQDTSEIALCTAPITRLSLHATKQGKATHTHRTAHAHSPHTHSLAQPPDDRDACGKLGEADGEGGHVLAPAHAPRTHPARICLRSARVQIKVAQFSFFEVF